MIFRFSLPGYHRTLLAHLVFYFTSIILMLSALISALEITMSFSFNTSSSFKPLLLTVIVALSSFTYAHMSLNPFEAATFSILLYVSMLSAHATSFSPASVLVASSIASSAAVALRLSIAAARAV